MALGRREQENSCPETRVQRAPWRERERWRKRERQGGREKEEAWRSEGREGEIKGKDGEKDKGEKIGRNRG